MSMKSYQKRVIKEKQDLDAKIVKLKSFLKENEQWSSKCDDAEWIRLQKQAWVMSLYSSILAERIEKFQS